MDIVKTIHGLFGERVLPLLIIATAIWATAAWKPGEERSLPLRIFAYLISLQFLLGLILWLYLVFNGGTFYLGFPFLLHPILGILALGIAHSATRPGRLFGALGRWSALAALGVVLLLVIAGVVVVRRFA